MALRHRRGHSGESEDEDGIEEATFISLDSRTEAGGRSRSWAREGTVPKNGTAERNSFPNAGIMVGNQ